ncbi:MAG: hypothetical protein AOA65_2139 [Candidatus Bathyarchaeota archaeon BA1]|nr:MAG: hypothetical protein AOA65_2139 [Candidatus Bathyarchaeota archaeon BA1]
MKPDQPKLCPDCPLLSLLPIILANRVCYTREKEQLTPHKICKLLRALWSKHPYVTLEECPYFSKNERIDLYVKPSAETR